MCIFTKQQDPTVPSSTDVVKSMRFLHKKKP